MSDLENLVIESLSKESNQFSPAPPVKILEREVSTPGEEEIIALCQNLAKKTEENPTMGPYLVAQISAYIHRGLLTQKTQPLLILSLAATYAIDPKEEYLQRISDWAEAIEKDFYAREEARLERIAIGSLASSVDFLKEFFGESLLEELQYLTSVTRPTAKRWISGGNMSWRYAQKIHLLARAFYALRHKQNLSEEKTLLWYQEPKGGKSPRELFREHHFSASAELRITLKGIGITRC